MRHVRRHPQLHHSGAHRTPAEVVERLDAVFEILVDIVDRHNGIVNKFLGDGLLAIFGAPIDDPLEAANAVAAAREMLRAIEASNVGHSWPIRLGIGIHIGQAVAGTVGSQRRKEYTVIGDTVNLASRLESLNKEVGSQLIVSDAVREAAEDPSAKLCRSGPSRCADTRSRSRCGASRRANCVGAMLLIWPEDWAQLNDAMVRRTGRGAKTS